MPWSLTPVVTCMLTLSLPGLLPSVKDKTSAFPATAGRLSIDHNYTLFGALYRACVLDSFGFGFPLPGLPSNFTSDLPVQLWSDGTFTFHCQDMFRSRIHISIRHLMSEQALQKDLHWILMHDHPLGSNTEFHELLHSQRSEFT